MRIRTCVIALLLLAPRLGHAQTTTDGVEALIRGQYATAVQILGPLADDAQHADPIAQFFMATMYYSGRGVKRDPMRACGYFVKAAVPPSALMVQAQTLARTVHHDIAVMRSFCEAAPTEVNPSPAPSSPELQTSMPIDQGAPTDYVDAFVRGDYQQAVEILKPIAEAPGQSNEAAQFFMAMMYENALGVAGSPTRACALYQFVEHSQGMFMGAAMELSGELRRTMRPEDIRDCELMIGEGFSPTFQSVTFALGPGHLISLDGRTATISYQGADSSFPLWIASPGAVFFPVEHTELRVEGSARQFVEIFWWTRGRTAQTWTLNWSVYEVVRNEWISVAGEQELAAFSGAQPPAAASSELHAMASLRVNARGEAEWEVFAGPHQRNGIIESDAERREKALEKRAREAAATPTKSGE